MAPSPVPIQSPTDLGIPQFSMPILMGGQPEIAQENPRAIIPQLLGGGGGGVINRRPTPMRF